MKRYEHRRGWRSRSFASLVSAALLVAAGSAAIAVAAPSSSNSGGGSSQPVGSESGELQASIDAFNEPRLAPSGVLSPGAYSAAWQHVQGMPVNQASYTE